MSTEHASAAVPPVDWAALRDAALVATAGSYAPYSGLRVGCAALVDDGRIVSGCNVENASYGLTLCAECVLVGSLHLGGGGRLTAFVCVDGEGNTLMPCGRCRQLLLEAAAPDFRIETPRGVRTMPDILPDAFGPEDLPA
ncbi:cytidine deaminase [Leucobacter sp. CSA2]|uniref:Cytidine deaminase n=1 Tax=Leucobacter edaphi TaxID=2796472 RepID=A0A934QBZ3_9MICO|nr:cytidine deaminase [Leucobacter edaphi]